VRSRGRTDSSERRFLRITGAPIIEIPPTINLHMVNPEWAVYLNLMR
jgi:hypothetical protein